MTTQQPEKLNVFLSWSLKRSQAVAQAFRDWLPSVLQNVRPYYTPDDIGKGSRWASEIRGELESSEFGIIFLTQENLASPWILFEAGALSKLEKSKVAPLLVGVEPADVSGPLAQLQLTKFSKDECLKLIKALNAALDARALEPAVLMNVFEKWWPDLEERVQKAMEIPTAAVNPNKRSDRELLEEVLVRIRSLETRPVPTTVVRRAISPAELASKEPGEVSLRELGLSMRAFMSLKERGLHTLADLLQVHDSDLIRITNLGKVGAMEVRTVLARYGLQLQQAENQ